MTASDARDELEAAIRFAATVTDGSGKPRSALGDAAVEGILVFADRYRDADPDEGDMRVVHLRWTDGHPACRYRWQNLAALALTGNPAAVTCARCRRSLRYRALTGGRR